MSATISNEEGLDTQRDDLHLNMSAFRRLASSRWQMPALSYGIVAHTCIDHQDSG